MGWILVGLVPALGFGSQSLVMQKIGGKYTNKLMGMAMGAVLFALIVFLFKRPAAWTAALLIGSLLSGLFWSIGQILQIKSFDYMGVTRAMPISIGTQLMGNALFGLLFFKEWSRNWQILLGTSALVLIIAGIFLTTYKEKKEEAGANIRLGVVLLILSSCGFVGYTVVPRIFGLNGWDMLLPQAVGMIVCTIIICATQKDNNLWQASSFKNIATGACFAIANFTLMVSDQMNGLAVGFTLSSLNVVVATLGGLLILHEQKTRKELGFILGGLLLVVVGGVFIGITKG